MRKRLGFAFLWAIALAMMITPAYGVEVFRAPTGVLQYDRDLADPGYVLWSPLQDDNPDGTGLTFLMDLDGRVIHTWPWIWNPQLRYLSLPSDYFALFLLLGITLSGDLMRYVFKVDVIQAKELVMSLIRFHPAVPDGIGAIFYIHLFLVSALVAYFPLSKLMHMGGVFLSPTRNLANNSRAKRHVNPWDYPVHVHTYQEYEDEFRDKLIAAEIPLDKE